MAQRPPPSENASNTTAVAIDKDKNSSFAVKWAIDNLSKSGHTLTLIHVRTKNSINRSTAHASESSSSGSFISSDPAQIFKPCRLYCARKGIAAQEVLIDDNDISKALLDYINKHSISIFVLGASSRNPIARKFSNPDVPTMINKAAPDFCSVYVISKDKALSIRPAARSAPLFTSPSPQHHAPHTPPESESHDGSREKLSHDGLTCEWRPNNRGQERRPAVDLDISFVSPNKPNIPNYNEFQPPKRSPSADLAPLILEAAEALYSEHDGLSSKDLEAKMKRLQLELKQTLDMYNTALLEKHKDILPMAELSKLKGKAVIEAVEKMHKLAHSEAEKTKHSDEEEQSTGGEALSTMPKNDVRYRRYTLEDIETATSNFAMSSKIGEGGYGPVFKGKLDHTPVAIKVLRSDATQGRQQFQQEIEVLSCMRHPNMVLLLGACPEYGCLVYEYMDNGSLEDRLFRKGNTPPIPWQIRFQIAADIAIGLLFLHQAKPEPLVHRDLKPANILLDRNYTCKISDVGLARLVPPSVADNVTQYHMTSAAGTFCYIDPEYQQSGKLGTKSDVYSLGVMLLQIITARPPMGLAHHVERTIEKGTLENILDPTVPQWPVEEALGFAKLALQCAELRKRDRPDLGSVIVPELNRLKEFGLNNLSSHRPTY